MGSSQIAMHSPPRNSVYQHVGPTTSVDSLLMDGESPVPGLGPTAYQNLPNGNKQESPIKRPRPSYWQRVCAIWMYGWVAETLSCVLAILSLLAVILVLRLYQNQPLPEWPMGITINALVSVFSILVKAGVAVPLSEGLSHLKWQWFLEAPRKLIDLEEFDAASRGPWGAFLFLLRFERAPEGHTLRKKMRSCFAWTRSDLLNTFAKLSAFLTVLSFAVDPFTQQVLQYSLCQQIDHASTASLARTNVYWAPGNGKASSSQEYTEDFDIAWAIDLGLTERPEVPSFHCATGNCTFPDFSTIGACHTCYDRSDLIRNWTDRLSDKDTTPVNNYAPYAWFVLPENNQTGEPKLELEPGSFLQSDSFSWPTPGGDPFGDIFITWRIMSVPYDEMAQVYGTPSAAVCDLNPCVRTLRSQVVNSTLQESETGRVNFNQNQANSTANGDDTWLDYFTAIPAGVDVDNSSIIIPAAAAPTAEGEQQQQPRPPSFCQGSDEPAPGQTVRWSANRDEPPRWYPAACVYSFSYYSNNAIPEELQRQMADLWHGPSYEGPLATVPRVIYGDSGVVDLDRVNFIMGNVADSMTASMRSRGGTTMDSAGEYVSGVAYAMVTCANVDWRWLAPSVALVFLATVWLGILAWQSLRGEATKRGWKSSTLALLFARIGDEEDKLASAVEEKMEKREKQLFDTTRFEMEELATSMDMQLVRDKDGVARFVSEGRSSEIDRH